MFPTKSRTIRVFALSHSATKGGIKLGDRLLPCALGRGGSRALKREGDGATPIGIWSTRTVLYRPDRVPRPRTRLACEPICTDDGWCDAPGDRNYNRAVRHPYPASAERLWRTDHVYDIIVVLGHNDVPRRRGMGSAIFMHLARDGFQPTEGCIAMRARDLRHLLASLHAKSRIRVG